ncbi:C40 family peptidase [Dermatophilus congolensis]|uniref:Probable endopeptidase p60 n=1 Tax=Dermatophilus congolensis TaxID=1863 RepID=A0AA46BNA4_9MICO|nr:C40 family peptidase [Dermatophilus congolensis]MBO3142992.1 hypothetical protein [Dermatophilus congolensis]MBO3151981.1 hypothetical protein [Dermatophilus congolensis]MBO3161011.1 hypothetical protein [Dermatophilus congolensis]MBO3163265.1 hypothetical protein [Dermatophilus congolensis]MBO3176822.1 hypothetical protein [Dermatophilus congolensis]
MRHIFAAAAAALTSMSIIASPAHAAPGETTSTETTPYAALALSSVNITRHAALTTAQAYAQQAPHATWQQKASNANHLATAMKMPGISLRDRIIAIAKTQVGTPYLWGGSTPTGFDCSGFTQYVYKKAGLRLPRTAAEQQQALTPTSKPRPGDLVFYGRSAHHVGIYLADGLMLHAPHTGKNIAIAPIYGTPAGYGRLA